MPNDFQIFVKPVGAVCNLGCTYCYYLDKKDLYHESSSLRMSDELLEKYIKHHIEASSDDIIMFSWHGGEPLLAGIDFYRKAVALQKKYLLAERSAINGIQTNGTLLDDEWCSFLKTENFIIGISIDGPANFHNKQRRTPSGDPTFPDVLKGYGLLQKYGITSEILCVVSSFNAPNPLEVYNFFKQIGVMHLTFLPLVEKESLKSSGVTDASVKPEDFGRFLISIFNEWTEHDIGRIKVQIFEEALRAAFDQEHTICIFKVDCGGVPVIEHNGDFYSCDHFVESDHLVGNIKETSLRDLLNSPVQKSFGTSKSKTLPRYCLDCEVVKMCNGECPKNRFIRTPDGEEGLNYLCAGYRMFFNHCVPFIEALKQVLHGQKR
ncbi:MAG: anaerobic sulfatase maturase [Bacteroidia bacterium]|nr:anaerobic sulfatase maturase [Bacteroidia bacterium]